MQVKINQDYFKLNHLTTPLTDKAISVQVPEDSYDMRVFPGVLEGFKPTGGTYWYRDLPPGSWRIVGLGSELKEDHWKGIVEKGKNGICYRYYLPGYRLTTIAIESGLSLLRSLKLDPKTSLILIKE